MLVRAEFGADRINNGESVEITFAWRSQKPTSVYLNFNTKLFTMDPTHFDLEAAPTTRTRLERVRITKLSVDAQHCDVHFVQGSSDEFDTVEVL